MRLLGRLILWSLLLWLGFTLYTMTSQWQGWRKSTVDNWDQAFGNYPVYWLSDNKSLNFDIPANAEQVRVQFTPTLSAQAQYSVHYKALGKGSKTLIEATQHYSIEEELVIESSEALPDRFFERPDGQLASFTRVFFIDNQAADPLSVVKLRLAQNTDVKVAVRVSILERKNAAELPILWQRMHRDKRALLMAEHIYPAQLISDAQRRTALQYSWLRVGPEGIEGEDYQTANLFIKNNIVQEVFNDQQLAANHMLVSESKVITFEQLTEVAVHSLSCDSLDDMALDWLELTIQNEQTLTRVVYIGDELAQPIGLALVPGLRQVRASALCQLALYDEQGKPIELPPNTQRGYVVNLEQPLNYALAINSADVQPIRLDIRSLNAQAGSINWCLLDNKGTKTSCGVLQLTQQQDMYESLPLTNTQEVLSAKVSRFIVAPAGSEVLQVTSTEADVLVNVFSRPLLLNYVVQPEQPKWFAVFPKGYNEIKAAGMSRLFRWQQRPTISEKTPALSQWKSLKSLGSQPGFELFVPTEPDKVNTYQALSANRLAVNFVADDQRKTLRPSLVYVQQEPVKPNKVSVSVDQQPPFEYWLAASAGRLALPAMDAGQHYITIDGIDSQQWFINKTENQGTYRVRSAYQLAERLTFEISKQIDREWLTFQYFPSISDAHTITIKLLHHLPSGEFSAHTVPNRSYHIPAHTGQGSAYVLNQGKRQLYLPQTLKFPLDEDLATGNYQLQVQTDSSYSGFVQASYVNNEITEILQQYTEVENAL